MIYDNMFLTKKWFASPELAEIVGPFPLTRQEIVKVLWSYIKKHNFQDPNNRKIINTTDKRLNSIFDGQNSISMFAMSKYLNKHIRD